MTPFLSAYRTAWAVLLVVVVGPVSAQESIRLQETFRAGLLYDVQTRVEVSGKLQPPAMSGKKAPDPLTISGESAIDYEEKILAVDRDGVPSRTARHFRKMDFERQMGKDRQQSSLRPAVRRLVLLRQDSTEVAFSPDGPLTWGELDLIRTDVFGPALAGLLPEKAVTVGERWKASLGAVRELTDLEQVEEGALECKLERITTVDRRRFAQVSLAGSVSGTNEDGPTRQQLDGVYYFDLDGNYLSYLSLRGKHLLLREKEEVGRVEGRFTMTRRAQPRSVELSDDALKGVRLEPDADNTRMLYENSELGVRFVHPRRWRMAGTPGRQVALDTPDGSGLLITVEPPARVPTGAQFLTESKDWLTKQKAKVLSTTQPKRLQERPTLESFSLEAEMGKEQVVMLYFITSQANGGATLAARVLPDSRAALEKEVEAIARSLTITKPLR